jgi:hypothetical protein
MAKSDPDKAKADAPVRPFADFLREQSKGKTHDEMSVALRDLVQRVADTGRPGSLVLTLSVKPLKGADNGSLLVSDAIKLKLPEHDRKASIFFSNEGNLQRTDPNQPMFETLRDLGGGEDTTTPTGEEKHA